MLGIALVGIPLVEQTGMEHIDSVGNYCISFNESTKERANTKNKGKKKGIKPRIRWS
jgi:hypothetical protein